MFQMSAQSFTDDRANTDAGLGSMRSRLLQCLCRKRRSGSNGMCRLPVYISVLPRRCPPRHPFSQTTLSSLEVRAPSCNLNLCNVCPSCQSAGDVGHVSSFVAFMLVARVLIVTDFNRGNRYTTTCCVYACGGTISDRTVIVAQC